MKFKGTIEVWSLDKKGKVKKYIKKSNVILNSGRKAFFSWDNYGIGWIAIGTDNTPPDPSQAGLLAQYRKESLGFGEGKEVGDYSLEFEHTFVDFTETVDICEAGLGAEDVCFNRATFDPITCDPDNNIKIKFTITVTD